MSTANAQSNATITDKEVICKTIESFLSKIEVPNAFMPIDQKFYDICCKRAMDQGYPMGTDHTIPSIRPFMKTGVYLAFCAYGHLENEATRIFMALYTAFLVYVDVAFVRDSRNVRVFTERFIRNEKQMDIVLDSLAQFLLEIPDHWEPVVASIILTATLNFITAPTLEYQTQGMTASPHAEGYPGFLRQMSGAAESYGLMLFPRNLVLNSYIQSLPEVANFLNFSNDVLSFYKEELEGDNVNYISVRARCQGVPAITAFQQLSDEVARCHAQVCKILEMDQAAYDIWKKFTYGYTVFHLSCDRYRFAELMN
ncbi:hypothetical protein HYPSUDRAFT_80866 [Hypholoma sublateritium FD-334 SS-4]|uniref:Terpene synthase n=1 Tax=Hypholoma sublateritium (strain FD-334 SS-4) TaxID=945553 RepID=A0A0D2NCL7_HYPSF|nr:hypothetical protein HYPSUDRAFT_80866 [Hypholoma sublateritium FD-334 SS-4]